MPCLSREVTRCGQPRQLGVGRSARLVVRPHHRAISRRPAQGRDAIHGPPRRADPPGGPADSLVMAVAPTDLDQGSFSDTPPWTLDDPRSLVWRQGLEEVRARVMAEVPVLPQPSRCPPAARLATGTRA